jgi:hypothetical protein
MNAWFVKSVPARWNQTALESDMIAIDGQQRRVVSGQRNVWLKAIINIFSEHLFSDGIVTSG